LNKPAFHEAPGLGSWTQELRDESVGHAIPRISANGIWQRGTDRQQMGWPLREIKGIQEAYYQAEVVSALQCTLDSMSKRDRLYRTKTTI